MDLVVWRIHEVTNRRCRCALVRLIQTKRCSRLPSSVSWVMTGSVDWPGYLNLAAVRRRASDTLFPTRVEQHIVHILLLVKWRSSKPHRVFDGITATPHRVFELIKEEMRLREAAVGMGNVSHVLGPLSFLSLLCNTNYVTLDLVLLLLKWHSRAPANFQKKKKGRRSLEGAHNRTASLLKLLRLSSAVVRLLCGWTERQWRRDDVIMASCSG